MQVFGVASDVLKDTQVLDTQASAPPCGILHLLASLRASVVLVSGRYPYGERHSKPSHEPSEMDPVECLARMLILPPPS
jgi:hypothetical protein